MLKFRLFSIPFTVKVSFLLVAVVLGFDLDDFRYMAAWVAVVFVSIVVHELGHALTARGLGADVAVELNAVGGLTRWSMSAGELSPGRRAVIAASGSFVGVVFGGVIWLLAPRFGPFGSLTAFVLRNLIFVNVFWGLLNWLPIRPLDGGHLVMSLLEKLAPQRAGGIARVVFVITSAAALGVAIAMRLPIIGLLAVFLLYGEITVGGRGTMGRDPTLFTDEAPFDVDSDPEAGDS